MPFESNVFLNCPFDDDFRTLLQPLVFTVLYFELEPKISRTQSSSYIRINQIKQHIRESKFGIHDLSRSKPMKRNELPRFNMPYELGLDIGCSEYGGRKYRDKRILILETERYHYQKVISDIAGQDIENHDDDPATLVRKVRNWFSTADNTTTYPRANIIWIGYNQFYDDMTRTLSAEGFTAAEIEDMPISDFIKFARRWIKKFKS
jgi:hypothetical protein